jgi:archaellum biogenesis ATPase FlaH
MLQPLEKTILRHLFDQRVFAETVTPYLKEEYFYTNEASLIYRLFIAFFQKYHAVPQFAAIRIGLDSVPSVNEREAKLAQAALDEIQAEPALADDQTAWILENTEEFCQDRAVYVGLQDSIKLMDDPTASRHAITDIMKQALSVSFDTHIGHDFFDDADARYEFYHKQEARIPFDLEVLNRWTKGGTPKKTLNVVLAGTNVGKSLFLVHYAAACLRMNKNVLYITAEMAEERIAERIDANMMNLPIDDVNMLPRSDYIRKIHHLRQSSTGRIIIKEYPTATAHVGHFQALLQELRLKQNFTPDIIFVDYLTICASSRFKAGAQVNSYSLYKFVAEELRGLAVEHDVPVWTAAQFNREGASSSTPDLSQIGESWAIPQTADFMFAMFTTEELDKLGQVGAIIMKNRYAKRVSYQQELFGIDTERMKLYDLSPGQRAAAVSVPNSNVAGSANASKPSVHTFSSRRRRPFTSLRKESGATDEE